MPPPFTDVGAVFPSKGLERTCEFGRQPADTAPDGENVLSEESITSRVRGGSRPGLSKYINETVVGDFVVQHINVLVDPQAAALRAESSTPGGVPDPSTNNITMRNLGRVVISGGSGRVPNRNLPTSPPPPLAEVPQPQRMAGARVFDSSGGAASITTQTCVAPFDGPVTAGNWAVVGVVHSARSSGSVSLATPTDTLGTSYTLVRSVGVGLTPYMSVFVGRFPSSGPNSITAVTTFTPPTSFPESPSLHVVSVEYSGLAETGLVLNDCGLAELFTNSTGETVSGGEVDPIETATSLYVAVLFLPHVGLLSSYAASDGFRIRKSVFPNVYIIDDVSPTNTLPSLSVEPSMTWAKTGSVISGAQMCVSLELKKY